MKNFTDSQIFDSLKNKWKEIPGTTQDRTFSGDLLGLSSSEFISTWQAFYDNNCSGKGYSVRGWYHDLYSSLAKEGGDWLDVGSGLGFDGVYFASLGANLTFFDIVEDNLKVIERVCSIKKIQSVTFKVIDGLETISALENNFDVVLAVGSLINAPFHFVSRERFELAKKLKDNGRWLELCYPKERWVREGSLEFAKWGKKTDGERTPWVEWYDLDKLLLSLAPHNFEKILSMNFHDHDFNWFDLKKHKGNAPAY